MGTDHTATTQAPRASRGAASRFDGRSALLLTGAAAWTVWVASHYYVFELTPPAIADGLLGSSFPYWREAAQRALVSLAGVSVTLLAAWGTGQLLLWALGARSRHGAMGSAVFDNATEQSTFALVCGLAVLSPLCLALAWLHVYRPPIVRVLVIVMAIATIAVRLGSRVHRETGDLHAPRNGEPQLTTGDMPAHRHDRMATGLVLLALAFALIGALAPEIEYDALSYHLWLPQQWLEQGAPVDFVHEYISLYPLSWDLLYGVAMTVGGPGAAKLLHFACLPLLAVATWLLTRSVFPLANPMVAAALAVVSPIVIWEATTAYVDLSLALFLTLSLHALTRFERTGSRRWLVLSAVMMGAALATKHLALVALGSMVVVLTVRHLVSREAWRPFLRHATVFLVIALALPAPWYARAYAASGNPVFPDLYGVFGARPPERWSAATEDGLRAYKSRFGRERSVKTLALLPWDMTVHGAQYGGTFGPAFLILLPLAFAGGPLRRSARLMAAGAGVYLLVWTTPVSSFQLRFIIPLVPVLAAFSAAGLANLSQVAQRLHPRAAGIMVIPLAIVLLLNLPPFTRMHERDRVEWKGWLTHVMRALPARVVLGALSTEQYLETSVPSYTAWRFINRTLPPDSRILTFSGGDQLYSQRQRIWSDAAAALPMTWAASAGHEKEVWQAAERLGISHVLFDKKQIADGTVANLAIRSEQMRTCCLTLIWQDSGYELYRFEPRTR